MKLTPEQFNILATKVDIKEIRKEMASMMNKDDKNEILNAVDKVMKKFDDRKTEDAANQAAHYRIQNDVNDVRNHVGLKIKNQTLEPESA